VPSTLLLLDEPLGALDLKVRTVLRYELRKLVKDLGLTAIHVTHDQEEALSISDRVVVMKAGKIVEVGSPMQLYLRPKEIFTAKFLGEANFIIGEVSGAYGGSPRFDVSGLNLSAGINGEFSPNNGETCVLAIRPEFIDLTSKPGNVNTWACEIVSASFVGDSMRYEVRTENGVNLLVKKPVTEGESGLVTGDKAYVTLPEGSLLLYRLPDEGLEKALSLE
jgi:ABC-type Fe3+/spermidine/putrescine transport system ATPase subunit